MTVVGMAVLYGAIKIAGDPIHTLPTGSKATIIGTQTLVHTNECRSRTFGLLSDIVEVTRFHTSEAPDAPNIATMTGHPDQAAQIRPFWVSLGVQEK